MKSSRYITIPAVKKDNELIPIWDDRVVYEKHELYGEIINLKDSYKSYSLVECIYDLKTKKLSAGIDIDVYPSLDDLPYKVGQTVMIEVEIRKLRQDKIVNIIFEKYESDIQKGNKIEKYKRDWIDIDLDDKKIYNLKMWEPTYVMESGKKISYEYQLYGINND